MKYENYPSIGLVLALGNAPRLPGLLGEHIEYLQFYFEPEGT